MAFNVANIEKPISKIENFIIESFRLSTELILKFFFSNYLL